MHSLSRRNVQCVDSSDVERDMLVLPSATKPRIWNLPQPVTHGNGNAHEYSILYLHCIFDVHIHCYSLGNGNSHADVLYDTHLFGNLVVFRVPHLHRLIITNMHEHSVSNRLFIANVQQHIIVDVHAVPHVHRHINVLEYINCNRDCDGLQYANCHDQHICFQYSVIHGISKRFTFRNKHR